MRRAQWKTSARRLAAWALALLLVAGLAPRHGLAAEEDVYLTAVNDVVLEMNAETMPFWSNGALYVSNRVFEGTDLGVTYVRNETMGLAVLYTPRSDLRFNLEDQTTTDKQGYSYSVHAIERSGYVFFPLDMICRYFGLAWSLNDTETVPLLRITSGSAILDDRSFIDAASSSLRYNYAAYQRQMAEQQTQEDPQQDDPAQAATGQRVHLLLTAQTSDDALAAGEALADGQTATFLLTLAQMEDGDLLRGLVAQGHAIALLAQGTTADEVAWELEEGRALLWQAACAWLNLVWYEGAADIGGVLEEMGCGRVAADLDRRGSPLTSAGRASALLGVIGEYRRDLAVYLGDAGACLTGLPALGDGLEAAGYRVCSWRMGTA